MEDYIVHVWIISMGFSFLEKVIWKNEISILRTVIQK